MAENDGKKDEKPQPGTDADRDKTLTDKEIEEVYSMVREGTPIYLLP